MRHAALGERGDGLPSGPDLLARGVLDRFVTSVPLIIRWLMRFIRWISYVVPRHLGRSRSTARLNALLKAAQWNALGSAK